MSKCKWEQDEVCVNADCPVCADFCPVTQHPEICKFAEFEGQKRTQGDKIRAMSDDELAHFWETRPDACPPIGTLCGGKNCYDCWIDWLKQEVSDNG